MSDFTLCTNCKHFSLKKNGTEIIEFVCNAFPNKIPSVFLHNHLVFLYHYKPVEGQVGDYVFEFNTLGDDYTLKFFYLKAMRFLESARNGEIKDKKFENIVLTWAKENPELVEKMEVFYANWKKKRLENGDSI